MNEGGRGMTGKGRMGTGRQESARSRSSRKPNTKHGPLSGVQQTHVLPAHLPRATTEGSSSILNTITGGQRKKAQQEGSLRSLGPRS